MNIKPTTDHAFAQYGFMVDGYDFAPLLKTLRETTEQPANAVVYVPSSAPLEKLPLHSALQSNLFGGMPLQLGYCNGNSRTLNCLEYHRGSEINIAADDVVLLLAPLQKINEGTLDTCEVEAFLLPAGQGVMLYETTLHYAPCTSAGNAGFRVIIGLPRGTNTEKPEITTRNAEDALLWACNKWLIAHKDAPEAAQGAFVGLRGENITL